MKKKLIFLLACAHAINLYGASSSAGPEAEKRASARQWYYELRYNDSLTPEAKAQAKSLLTTNGLDLKVTNFIINSFDILSSKIIC